MHTQTHAHMPTRPRARTHNATDTLLTTTDDDLVALAHQRLDDP